MSGEEGKSILNVSENNNAAHSFYFKGEDSSGTQSVATISLKHFLHKYKIKKIDFLKIDCEGAEYEILFNCDFQTISKIDNIAMEFHNIDAERNCWSVIRYLQNCGFKTNISFFPDGIIYAYR